MINKWIDIQSGLFSKMGFQFYLLEKSIYNLYIQLAIFFDLNNASELTWIYDVKIFPL